MSADVFVAMWDNTGLEYLINWSAIERNQTWATLGNKPPPQKPNLNHLILRARYNSQRHYEIYSFSVDEGIEQEDIEELFESSPQYIVDLIRERGKSLYSDRADKSKVLIV
jgi:hypothetical protein